VGCCAARASAPRGRRAAETAVMRWRRFTRSNLRSGAAEQREGKVKTQAPRSPQVENQFDFLGGTASQTARGGLRLNNLPCRHPLSSQLGGSWSGVARSAAEMALIEPRVDRGMAGRVARDDNQAGHRQRRHAERSATGRCSTWSKAPLPFVQSADVRTLSCNQSVWPPPARNHIVGSIRITLD